jgi:hypothetical protein
MGGCRDDLCLRVCGVVFVARLGVARLVYIVGVRPGSAKSIRLIAHLLTVAFNGCSAVLVLDVCEA